MMELVQDPDAGHKLSASRAPLIVWFVLVTLVATAIGAALLWTHLGCAGVQEVACDPLAYEDVSGYLDRMLEAFWAFGAVYVGGKGVGKLSGRRE